MSQLLIVLKFALILFTSWGVFLFIAVIWDAGMNYRYDEQADMPRFLPWYTFTLALGLAIWIFASGQVPA